MRGPSLFSMSGGIAGLVLCFFVDNHLSMLVDESKANLVRPLAQWKFFSQQNEDKDLFREFFWKNSRALYNGTFLEVGALDGVTFSNTLMYERELAWSGMLIEGCPSTAAQLEKNRGGVKTRNTIVMAAVCQKNESYINYTIPCNAMSGFNKNQGDAFMIQVHSARKSVRVSCKPLSEMIRDAKMSHIDLVSIDVEGYEVSLVKTIDFSQVSIGVLVIKVNHNNENELLVLRSILIKAGLESRGLQGMHYANEIWVNPCYSRRSEQWIPLLHVHEQLEKSAWRLNPCATIPSSNRMEIAERDRKNESTNFLKYVASFERLVQCRESITQMKLRTGEEEAMDEAAAEVYAKTGYHPITFTLSAHIFKKYAAMRRSVKKTKLMSAIVPGGAKLFLQEVDYMMEYASSWFALTKKKAGWDCMRHLEIIAAGCIPVFEHADLIPPYIMAFYPKALMRQIASSFSGATTRDMQRWRLLLLRHMESHLIAPKVIHAMEKMSGVSIHNSESRVLFIDERIPKVEDYLSLMVLTGLLERFGSEGVDVMFPVPYMYQGGVNHTFGGSKLYGNGFNYAWVLPGSPKLVARELILKRVTSCSYDAIVYGREGSTFWSEVSAAYNVEGMRKRVWILNGEDCCFNATNAGPNKGWSFFVRELIT